MRATPASSSASRPGAPRRARALNTLAEEEGTRPVNAAQLEAAEEERIARMVPGEDGFVPSTSTRSRTTRTTTPPSATTRGRSSDGTLPTLRVFPHGVSRKRLEQAIKDLQLPVIIAREPDEADVAMTLRSEYRQKPPALREVEDRGLPIYVLKANTIAQMQASLTSIFSLEVDPREAALSRDRAGDPDRHEGAGAGGALAPERLHPPAPAPDGRAGEHRVAVARP